MNATKPRPAEEWVKTEEAVKAFMLLTGAEPWHVRELTQHREFRDSVVFWRKKLHAALLSGLTEAAQIAARVRNECPGTAADGAEAVRLAITAEVRRRTP